MADITHGTWIKDGKAVDAVYQSGVKIYGRNLIKGGSHQTILADNSNSNNFRIFYTGLIPNQTYTLSMIASLTGSSNSLVTIALYSNDIGAPALVIHTMVADGTTRKWQFTVPNNGLQLLIYAGKQFNTTGIGLDIKQLKLETGDQTAFSIAPEDILN